MPAVSIVSTSDDYKEETTSSLFLIGDASGGTGANNFFGNMDISSILGNPAFMNMVLKYLFCIIQE